MSRTPCFFVQNNYVERLTIPVARFAHENGYTLVDRSSTSSFDAEDCGVDWAANNPILPYGSVQFIKKLKKSPSLAPFVLHEDARFAAAEWAVHLGSALLNQAGRLISAGDVPDLLSGVSQHIRPNSEDKAFNAKVFDQAEWAAMVNNREIAPDFLCWASTAQPIAREWRCWIVDGKLVEASQYRANGAIAIARRIPYYVLDFVTEKARGWLPAPCVVMDVAELPDALKIIEFNPIHCAGWYAANVPVVLSSWLRWAQDHYANEVTCA